MLDILDKKGKVVAVLMDDGRVIKKDKLTDDVEEMVRQKLAELKEKGK